MNGMQMAQAFHMALMVPQMAVMLFKPELSTDMIPEMAVPHSAGYRMVGLTLMGLFLLYGAGVATNDYMLAAVTSAGRLFLVPVALISVIVFHLPPAVALAICPDVIMALITLFFVQKEGAHVVQARGLDEEESKPELWTRLFLALAGAMDVVEGVLMIADPINYSDHPIIANPYIRKGPRFYGIRTYGLMLGIMGAYQMASMASRAPSLVYTACGAYHIIFAAGLYFLGDIVGDPQLSKEINHPLYHVPLGLLVFIFSINIPRPSGVAHAKKD